MLHCTFVKNFAMHALLKNILLREEFMRITFEVDSVTVQEYMRTYQEYLGKLPI